MPKQHKYLLLTYQSNGKTYSAISTSFGAPSGFEIEPDSNPIINTRKQANHIITRLSPKWIKQIHIHKPYKIIELSPFIVLTEYTPYQYFVNKIRKLLHLHEKY